MPVCHLPSILLPEFKNEIICNADGSVNDVIFGNNKLSMNCKAIAFTNEEPNYFESQNYPHASIFDKLSFCGHIPVHTSLHYIENPLSSYMLTHLKNGNRCHLVGRGIGIDINAEIYALMKQHCTGYFTLQMINSSSFPQFWSEWRLAPFQYGFAVSSYLTRPNLSRHWDSYKHIAALSCLTRRNSHIFIAGRFGLDEVHWPIAEQYGQTRFNAWRYMIRPINDCRDTSGICRFQNILNKKCL